MSDAPESSGSKSPETTAGVTTHRSEPKPRNPFERVLVWGAILTMVVLVSIEAFAKFSYDMTFSNLTEAIEAAEADGKDMPANELGGLITGSPKRTESALPHMHGTPRTNIDYQWWSIFKTYRIVVEVSEVGKEGEMVVLGFSTDAPPEVEQAPIANVGEGGDASVTAPDPGMMAPGGPGGGHGPGGGGPGEGGGPGGGRPPLAFSDLDANVDGALSADELPEFMQARFGDIDTDGDETISEEEFENRPRRNPGGGPGAPAGGSAPDRPELETPDEGASGSGDVPPL